MTRARRVHQGERTQSDVGGYTGETFPAPPPGYPTDLVPHPVADMAKPAVLDRRPSGCRSCEKVYGDRTDPVREIAAPSGNMHLSEDGNVTLCGRDITDDWAT